MKGMGGSRLLNKGQSGGRGKGMGATISMQSKQPIFAKVELGTDGDIGRGTGASLPLALFRAADEERYPTAALMAHRRLKVMSLIDYRHRFSVCEALTFLG